MEQLYLGYSIMPGPNDPGVIIRQLPDRNVVGSAASYGAARLWIDSVVQKESTSRAGR